MRHLLSGLLILFLATSLPAQDKAKGNSQAVKTIDGIVNEVLRISAREKGKIPDWEAFRNLFLPTATFTVLNHGTTFPTPSETVTLEEFIQLMQDQYYEEGYIEYELGKVVNEYNGIANVFQAVYQKDSENLESKAMNSYQLIYFNSRWWVVNLIWTTNLNGVEIPRKYQRKKR
jgi:hypothetical protein